MVRLALWGLDPLTDTRNLEVGQTLIGWAAKEENAIRELPATDQYPASHWCIFCSGDQDWNVDTPIPHRPECPHKLSQKLQDGR